MSARRDGSGGRVGDTCVGHCDEMPRPLTDSLVSVDAGELCSAIVRQTWVLPVGLVSARAAVVVRQAVVHKVHLTPEHRHCTQTTRLRPHKTAQPRLTLTWCWCDLAWPVSRLEPFRSA